MNQELVDYIKQQTNLNVSKNKITDILLGQGWQQAELDEAFAAVEGVSLSLRFPKSSPLPESAADNFDENPESSGSGRKMAVIVAAVLVVVAVAAGIVLLAGGSNKNVVNNTGEGEKSNVSENTNAATNTENVNLTPATSTGAATEIKAELAVAAKDLAALIVPPSGWTGRQGIMRSRPLAAFFKPTPEKDESGKEIMNENISITREDYRSANASTTDDYIANSKVALKNSFSDYKITAERKVNLSDGTPATLLGGNFTQDKIALRNMQLFVFKGNDVYVVTAVVLASNWNQEKDMIGTSVMSFKLP